MSEKKITAKMRKKLHRYVRAGIQLLFFIFLPAAFTTAFSGIKYVFNQLSAGKAVEFTSFVSVLIALCLFTIVFGRFFCGYACAFGSLGDAVHALYLAVFKKLGKKPFLLDKKWKYPLSLLKYGILMGIVLLCFTGVYGNLPSFSPWEVFSMLRAGNFNLSGHFLGILLLLLIFVGMAVCERFFCRFLCPMGAVFSILPVLPIFSLKRNREVCPGKCSACEKNCPSDIALPDKDSWEVNGDCFMCQKCAYTCPRTNIEKTGFAFTIVRAILLAIVMILAGV
jgi:polyferredoxin